MLGSLFLQIRPHEVDKNCIVEAYNVALLLPHLDLLCNLVVLAFLGLSGGLILGNDFVEFKIEAQDFRNRVKAAQNQLVEVPANKQCGVIVEQV